MKKAESVNAAAAETPVSQAAEKPAKKAKSPKSAKAASKNASEFSASEVHEMVLALANQGYSGSQIGALLRDQHHIFSVREITQKPIAQILSENKLIGDVPEDLLALIRRVIHLDKHLAENKKDFSAKRGSQLTVSKIRRLVKYYHKTKQLPKDWHYSIETARLLVK
ncbi:MAG: 30S ribosomal protein S15 [Candidatus Micrarchaeota archaeon]